MSDVNDELVRLHLENDLLRHENRILRSKVSSGGGGGALEFPEREALIQARKDLRGFIRRLASTPARPALRLWPGFRYLEDTYVHDKSVPLR